MGLPVGDAEHACELMPDIVPGPTDTFRPAPGRVDFQRNRGHVVHALTLGST
jgi:hypothetical protein